MKSMALLVLTCLLQLCLASLTFNSNVYTTSSALLPDVDPPDCLSTITPPPPSIQGRIYIMNCKGKLPNEFLEDFILVLNSTFSHYCADFNTNDVVQYFKNQYVLAVVVLDSLTMYPLRYDYRTCQEALTKQIHYVDSKTTKELKNLLQDGEIISIAWGNFFLFFFFSFFLIF